MTPIQAMAVERLKNQGFTLTQELKDAVRMVRGADIRIVMQDGMTKRGHHASRPYKGCK
jgi:endonuclease V-like protein UPF0215 family